MSSTSRVIFHFYDSGHVAAQLDDPFTPDSVLTEILFFCLLVSRTALKVGGKRTDAERFIEWVESFRSFAVAASNRELDETGITEVADNPLRALFNGVSSFTKLIATLTLKQTDGSDYSFSVKGKGWFSLSSPPTAYGRAMACLWCFLMQKRRCDLGYVEALNASGYLVGKASLDGELSLQSEGHVIRKVLETKTNLQLSAEPARTE